MGESKLGSWGGKTAAGLSGGWNISVVISALHQSIQHSRDVMDDQRYMVVICCRTYVLLSACGVALATLQSSAKAGEWRQGWLLGSPLDPVALPLTASGSSSPEPLGWWLLRTGGWHPVGVTQ